MGYAIVFFCWGILSTHILIVLYEQFKVIQFYWNKFKKRKVFSSSKSKQQVVTLVGNEVQIQTVYDFRQNKNQRKRGKIVFKSDLDYN